MKKFFILASFLCLASSMQLQAQQVGNEQQVTQEALQAYKAKHIKMTNETTYIKNGGQAIDIEVAKYTGGKLNLSKYKGKVIHICFWASWCGPCLQELKAEHLPSIIAPYQKKSDYVLVPIALEKKESLDKFFATKKGQEYAWLKDITGYDPERVEFNKYAKSNIPRTVVIDRNGKVVETTIGGNEYEMELIREALEKLF